MIKIKKQAQSIYAFKETGGEVLNFQIEKDCLKLFSEEEILCEINDEIISKRYFKIKKVKLSDEKVCIFCHDGVYDYLLISYTGKNLKYTLGEGVADFLVLNDAAYVIYSEEGKFGSEENLPIAQLGLIKIDIFIGEITGLLDDCILETLIDVHTMSCNNKTIRILCYEENDNDFTLDYDLTSKKVQNKVIINYTVDGLLSAGDSFYARYQNHIYQVNESMEITKEIIIDKKVYDEASSLSTGYSEVVLESENEFSIVQLSKL
ncbi:hypothetical protein [Listeria welshimeri]|uniref:hypothetical protein n=1 Tax=Listeria welshimeri TaxID=1643 RepID=UPI00162351F0|nr:hypothetical protein [Listeria welshimeri]MBC1782389.1 hypothetical protein [Listeria welshimeri]MBF2455450.1 hypothetical protein [Listeria welshimeri]MBF2569042.1 hypothetical protein [Listeria welshimeri]